MGRVAWPVKWVLGPMIATALGYYVVGPRYAGKVPDAVKKGVERIAPDLVKAPEGSAAPHVSVGVKPVEEPPPRRRSGR